MAKILDSSNSELNQLRDEINHLTEIINAQNQRISMLEDTVKLYSASNDLLREEKDNAEWERDVAIDIGDDKTDGFVGEIIQNYISQNTSSLRTKYPKHKDPGLLERYTPIFGSVTNHWYILDKYDNVYIDPPTTILDYIESLSDDRSTQETEIYKLIEEDPSWLETEMVVDLNEEI